MTRWSLLAWLPIGCCLVACSARPSIPPKPPRRLVQGAPTFVPRYVTVRYANGLEVLVAEADDVPLVSIAVASRAGSAAAPEQPGLARAAWRTALLHAGGRDVRDTLAAFDDLGAAASLRVEPEGAVLQVTVLKDGFPAAAALLADVLRGPVFDRPEPDCLGTCGLLESDTGEASPPVTEAISTAHRVLAQRIFGAHPAGRSQEDGGAVEVEALRRFHRQYVGPATTSVVVAGAVSATEVARQLDPLLGSWHAETRAPPRVPPPRPRPADGIVFVPRPGQSEAVVAFARPLPPEGIDPVTFEAASVRARSWVWQELREVCGVPCVGALRQERLAGAAWFHYVVIVPPDATGAALKGVRKALDRASQADGADVADGAGEGDVYFLGDNPSKWLRLTDTVADLARTGAYLRLHQLDHEVFFQRLNRARRLTYGEVRGVLEQHFDPVGFHVVVVGDPERVLPRLERLRLPVIRLDGDAPAGR